MVGYSVRHADSRSSDVAAYVFNYYLHNEYIMELKMLWGVDGQGVCFCFVFKFRVHFNKSLPEGSGCVMMNQTETEVTPSQTEEDLLDSGSQFERMRVE